MPKQFSPTQTYTGSSRYSPAQTDRLKHEQELLLVSRSRNIHSNRLTRSVARIRPASCSVWCFSSRHPLAPSHQLRPTKFGNQLPTFSPWFIRWTVCCPRPALGHQKPVEVSKMVRTTNPRLSKYPRQQSKRPSRCHLPTSRTRWRNLLLPGL